MMAAVGGNGGGDLGRLILRLALGILVLLHGIAKIAGGPAGIVGLVEKAGLPGPLGYLVYLGEVLAPLLLIAGWWTRLAALVIAINMVVAVALVHQAELLIVTKNGGWALELQGMYFFSALALVFLGAGRFSLGGARGRFN
ncbi:MAG: DoxX family protein [Burkholderiales bacterium]|nr:DoxX family protein [Burkholderiales bacterium]